MSRSPHHSSADHEVRFTFVIDRTSIVGSPQRETAPTDPAASVGSNVLPDGVIGIAEVHREQANELFVRHPMSVEARAAFRLALKRQPTNEGHVWATRVDDADDTAGDDDIICDAFGLSPRVGDAVSERPDEADLDPSSIAYVEADVEAALANHSIAADTEAATPVDDAEEPWTDEDIAAFFREAARERVHPRGTVSARPTTPPPIRVTSGLRASVQDIQTAKAPQGADAEAKAEPRRRGKNRKTRVITALRTFIADDPRYQGAREVVAEARRRYDEILSTAASDQHKVDAARKAYVDSINDEVDFHLSHLASVADRIGRCGAYGAFACRSYWCTHCRNRYAARLIEDTRAQLKQRYGADLENARANSLHATILNEIVLPDPDLDREHLADFAASIVRRDGREMLGYLGRWQDDRLSAMSAVLVKRGLSLALAEDRIGLTDRDRRFYHPDNVTSDADRLIGWNDVIVEARDRFRSRRKRPDLESATLVSCRDDERYEAYLWQLRKATPLDREDIVTLAQGFSCIYREFTGITKTNYPERLKFKSSIEKVMRRERKKLYRISKDDQLPGVSITGMFEMELVDLRHAIGGDHRHSVKAKTLRVLATQERKPPKKRKEDDKPSPETERRRMKHGARMRLLDEARARIAADEELPEGDFPGLRYAVLLHMHVLIDLNGTPRGDVERWLTGEGASSRRFIGQWRLPYQVMVKALYENKSVDDSIRDISFYAIKAPLTFNYENTAPKRDDELVEGGANDFPDEALAILAWLQQGIGHESLRITVGWPGVGQEKRGPKPKRTPEPKMTDEELDEALAAQGSSLPRPPIGETDIGFLLEVAGDGAQGTSDPAQVGTPPDGDEDAPGSDGEEDPPGRHSSDPGDQEG